MKMKEKYLLHMSKNNIRQAIEILKNGGVGIFPTDTVFGIGCRMDDEKAVARLFSIKGRAAVKATPVLVSSIAMAEQFLQPIPEKVKKTLLERYWPGALTVIMPCLTEKVPSLVRGTGDTLGVRMPNHPLILHMIEEVGVPILGTSANFSGGATPSTEEALDKALIEKVDFVIPGTCPVGMSSTIIDVTVIPWKIVREGTVKV